MKLIPYFRVSTARQGASGLGLEAQQAAVEAYAQANNGLVLASYTEIESGRNNDRPKLQAALLHAKRARATLVVAKLDRLARNVAFLSTLMDSEVNFVACDNPHANRLLIQILAVIAENEADAIRRRVREALKAAKARGTLLGSARPGHWVGREDKRLEGALKATRKAAEARKQLAAKAREEVGPIMKALQEEGLKLVQIANRLNEDGWTTLRGKPWRADSVCRVMKALVVTAFLEADKREGM